MKKLKKVIKIIEGVFNTDPFFVTQFIFIYPRFMLFDCSLAKNKLDYFSNKLYIGDNYTKLIYEGHKKTKFLNGILEVVTYQKTSCFEQDERFNSYSIDIEVPEERGCWSCLYRKDKRCNLFKFDIKDERFVCDDWEEKGG